MPTVDDDRLWSVCPDCGTPFERTDNHASCLDCMPRRHDKPSQYLRGSTTERGYDGPWRRLSERARRLQPFCTDCGTTEDLTADHSTRAWQRKAEGKALRLRDIDVVCRACNAERGAARGERANDQWRQDGLPVLDADIESELHPGG